MLRRVKFPMLLALGLGLSACGSVERLSHGGALQMFAGPGPGGSAGAALVRPQERSYRLERFSMQVPADLTVSEANGFYPVSDIVWRGDPRGDRRRQVAAMFQEAARRNERLLVGSTPIIAEARLARFHGVTERTRFSVGGVYHVVFYLTIRHAGTGAILEPMRKVSATLPAPGGTTAVALDQQGQTEKVRVTDFLTRVLREELSAPPAG